jgi:hypothetical protein
MSVSMVEIFRPVVNLETQTNRKDTGYPKKVQVGSFFGKNPQSFQTPVNHVVPDGFNIGPERSGHGQENNPPVDRRNVKCLDVTPQDLPESARAIV